MSGEGFAGGRDVEFRLKLVNDPASKQNLRQLAEDVARAQKAIATGMQQSVKAMADDAKRAAADIKKSIDMGGAGPGGRSSIATATATAKAVSTVNVQLTSMQQPLQRTSEGLSRLVGGIGMLGIASGSSTEAILKNVLRLKGAIDTVAGGLTLAGQAGLTGGAAAGAGATATTVGAFAAAITSATAGVIVFGETVRDIGRHGLGGGSSPGSLSAKIGEKQAGAMVSFEKFGRQFNTRYRLPSVFNDAAEAEEKTERMTTALEASRARQAREEMLRGDREAGGALRGHALGQLSGAMDKRFAGFRDLAAMQGRGAERNQIASEIADRSRGGVMLRQGLAGEATESGRRAIIEEIMKNEARIIELRKEDVRLVRQIGDDRRKTIRDSIAGIEKEIETRRKSRETVTERFLGAAEQFGQMDVAEQRRLMQLKQHANAGGNLTIGQRQELAGLGLQDDKEALSQAARRRADAAGFAKLFGRSEQREAALSAAAEQRLTFELRDKRTLEAKLVRDDVAIARRVAEQLRPQIAQADEEMVRRIVMELRKDELKLRDEVNMRERVRMDAARAR